MRTVTASPLAQLVDLFGRSTWHALLVLGLAAPITGLVIYRLIWHRPVGTRGVTVLVYYLLILPLAVPVFSGTGNAGLVCTFLTLMPVGIIIGLRSAFMAPAAESRRRFPEGHCQKCGYDLRATPDRCPECGSPVNKTDSLMTETGRTSQAPPEASSHTRPDDA
jgi:hypothetical protein